MNNTEHPLVLVFYLDRELMRTPEIIGAFSESVNNMIAAKKLNMVCFFMPTDGEERIECINPVLTTPDEKEKINNLIKEIEKNFSIGDDMQNIPNIDI